MSAILLINLTIAIITASGLLLSWINVYVNAYNSKNTLIVGIDDCLAYDLLISKD